MPRTIPRPAPFMAPMDGLLPVVPWTFAHPAAIPPPPWLCGGVPIPGSSWRWRAGRAA